MKTGCAGRERQSFFPSELRHSCCKTKTSLLQSKRYGFDACFGPAKKGERCFEQKLRALMYIIQETEWSSLNGLNLEIFSFSSISLSPSNFRLSLSCVFFWRKLHRATKCATLNTFSETFFRPPYHPLFFQISIYQPSRILPPNAPLFALSTHPLFLVLSAYSQLKNILPHLRLQHQKVFAVGSD